MAAKNTLGASLREHYTRKEKPLEKEPVLLYNFFFDFLSNVSNTFSIISINVKQRNKEKKKIRKERNHGQQLKSP